MKEKGKTLPKRTPGGTVFKHARAYRGVYLMATPVLVSALIFYYLPMFGIRYAFFTYKGINDPIFVGMKHFVKMFSMPGFWKAFSNTLVLSITKLILNTGAAVIISVCLEGYRLGNDYFHGDAGGDQPGIVRSSVDGWGKPFPEDDLYYPACVE